MRLASLSTSASAPHGAAAGCGHTILLQGWPQPMFHRSAILWGLLQTLFSDSPPDFSYQNDSPSLHWVNPYKGGPCYCDQVFQHLFIS